MSLKSIFMRLCTAFIRNFHKRKEFRQVFNSSITNKILLIEPNGQKINNPQIDGIFVNFSGENNSLILHSPLPVFSNCHINFIGSNSSVEILSGETPDNWISNLGIRIENSNNIFIGHNFCCNGVSIDADSEPNVEIKIGNDVMCSWGIIIRTTDAHSIIDKEGNILNKADNIEIGDHVWICQNVSILKGSKISNNSICALGSIINKKFSESNVLIAGIPAKIAKHSVSWDRKSPHYFQRRIDDN